MPNYDLYHHIIRMLQSAPTASSAVTLLLQWLSDHHGPAVIGLLQNNATPDLFIGPNQIIDQHILDWLYKPDWHSWDVPRFVPDNGVPGPAMVIPLRYENTLFGVIWLYSAMPPTEQVSLLAYTLTARLYYLSQHGTLAAFLNDPQPTPRLSMPQAIQLDTLLEMTARVISHTFGYLCCHTYLFDTHQQLKRISHYGDNAARMPQTLTLETLGVHWPQHQPLAPLVRQELPCQQQALWMHPAATTQMILFMQVDEKRIGLLYVEANREITAHASQTMQEIANCIALVIHNGLLALEIRELAVKLGALDRVLSFFNHNPQLDDLARHVYHMIDQLQQHSVFQFAIYDRERGSIQVDLYNRSHNLHINLPYAPERDLISQVIARETPIMWNSPHDREALGHLFTLVTDRPTAFLGVPMISQGRVVGAICLFADQEHTFDNNSVRLVTSFANSVAIAVESARTNHTLERRAQEIDVLTELSQAIAQQPTQESILEQLQQHMQTLFGTSSFFMALSTAGRLSFPLASSDDDLKPILRLHEAVMQHGVPIHFSNLLLQHERLAALGISSKVQVEAGEYGWPIRSWLGVPLHNRNHEVIGVISVQNVLPDSYTDSDLTLLLAIAAQTSLALENIQLMESEQERRRIASTLIDVSRDVSSTLQYDDVLDRILEQMQRVVAYDSASILLTTASEAGHHVATIAATQGIGPNARGHDLTFAPNHPVSQVIASGQPLILPHAPDHPAWVIKFDNVEHAPVIRGWLGVPLLVENQTIGIITLDKHEANFYTERDASTAFAVARQAAVAVQNARMHARTQQQNQRLTAIHSISTLISTTLDTDTILQRTVRQITTLFTVDHCVVFLFDDQLATAAAEYPLLNMPTAPLNLSESNLLQQTTHGQPITVLDMESSPFIETDYPWQQLNIHTALLVPLNVGDIVLGALTLHSIGRQRRFTHWEIETLTTIAGQLALAIANAHLYEQALDASRIKNQFLANISHELRTPLNSIIGYSNLLKSEHYGTLTPAQLDRITRIYSGGQHLLGLINNILDFTRIEAGQMQINREAVSLSAIVEDVISYSSFRAEEKGLHLVTALPPYLPDVIADSQHLQQVLINLLDNAIKFTHTGSVTIQATTLPTEGNRQAFVTLPEAASDGMWVIISVKDTGIGISAADQRNIFEAFHQVDGSSTRQYTGSGLGLAICQQLVRLHGGHLWVESAPQEGSTFYVLLPQARKAAGV